MNNFQFASRPAGLGREMALVVVGPAVAATHGGVLVGAGGGAVVRARDCQSGAVLLLWLRADRAGILAHLDKVQPREALLLPHQALVGEGDVPGAIVAAHR